MRASSMNTKQAIVPSGYIPIRCVLISGSFKIRIFKARNFFSPLLFCVHSSLQNTIKRGFAPTLSEQRKKKK